MSPELAAEAAQAAAIMKAVAHEGHLLVLCYLAEAGEMPVGQLADRIGKNQSALSQHLALFRAELGVRLVGWMPDVDSNHD